MNAYSGYGYTGYGAGYGVGYGTAYCCNQGYGNNYFGIILVLFILLVIIGCSCYNSGWFSCGTH